ncbi:MAG: hypothetical protein Q7S47_00555 [bacterium]|nr:hypothetical protein [bacterium]
MRESGPRFEAQEEERMPNLKFEFFFESHDKNLIPEKLLEKISHADLFAPEHVGWTKDDQKMFDRISSGGVLVDELLKKGAAITPRNEAILRAMAESNTHGFFIEIPEGLLLNTLNQRRKEKDERSTDALQVFLKGDFDGALEKEKELRAHFTETIRMREEAIIKSFHHRVSAALKKHPELAEKDTIHILIMAGSVHTNVFHSLRNSLNARMSANATFSPSSGEIIRREQHGKEIPDSLYAQSLLESLIERTYLQKSAFQNLAILATEDRLLVERYLVSFFSINEIRSLSSRTAQEKVHPLDCIEQELKQKGASLPDSPESTRMLIKKLRSRVKLKS